MKVISKNPSRGYEVVGEIEASTRADVQAAVEAARIAGASWGATAIATRCQYIAAFLQVAQSRAEDIARLMSLESGLPIRDARQDTADGIQYLKTAIGQAVEVLTPQVISEGHTQLHRIYREARGVAAAICSLQPSFLTLARQCGAALLAGNVVVYLDSGAHLLFSGLMAELVATTGIPTGVFTVIHGDDEAGKWLAECEMDMILFCGGDSPVLRMLALAASQRSIPFMAEPRGSGATVVFEDADIVGLIDYIFGLGFHRNRQPYIASRRLVVHESRFDELVQKLRMVVEGKRVGDASDETTDLGPLASKRELELIEAQVREAVHGGASVVTGGARPEGLDGAYYLPTILTGVSTDMRVWQEEVAGAVLPVVSFASEEEAVGLAHDGNRCLSVQVMTADLDRFRRIAGLMRARVVAQNAVGVSEIERPNDAFGFEGVTKAKLVCEEK